jgi:hypothetical protein
MVKQRLLNLLYNLTRPENLINLIAVIVAVVLGYRSIQVGTSEQYFQAVLTVLGVLAFSQLIASYTSTQREAKIARIAESMSKIEESAELRISADKFLAHRVDFSSIEEIFKDADRIEAVGTTLISFGTIYQALIHQRITQGCCARLVITNHVNKNVADIAAQKMPESPTRETHMSQARTALMSLSGIAGQHSSGGSLEIKVLDTFPPFGLLIINGDQPNGRIRVELYPDNCPIAARPMFELFATRDGEWYRFFRQQFEILWQKAVVPPRRAG